MENSRSHYSWTHNYIWVLREIYLMTKLKAKGKSTNYLTATSVKQHIFVSLNLLNYPADLGTHDPE